MGRMTLVHRVLPPSPYLSLDEYEKAGGGRGLENATGGGAGGDHRRDRGVRAARPRRRRLPDRAQVAQRGRLRLRRPGHDGRRQRGRGRAGHAQGPHHPAPQPLRGHRGRPHRRPAPWTPGPIVIATKASFTRGDRPAARRHRRDDEGGLDGRPRHLHLRGARGVPLRRGDRAARGPRRPPAVPPHRAALPAGRGRGRRDRRRCHRRQRAGRPRRDGRRRDRRAVRARRQRRDDGQRPEDHRPGRGLVPHRGHRPLTGDAGLHHHRRHPPERGRRGPDGDDPARGHPGDRRRARGGPDHQGRADRRVQRRARARAARHPAHLRGHAGRRERSGLGQLPRLRPARRHGRGGRRRGPLPGRRVLRAVHARASRTGWRSRTAWPRSAPAPRPRST